MTLAALLLLFGLSYWIRIARAGNWGEQLAIYPDAVEYAAGAQSLVGEGRYVLHLGPLDARPHYSPGFSMLLAPFVAAGLPGDALWQTGLLFGWLLACLTAASVAYLASIGAERASGTWRLTAIAVVASCAGATWLVAPFSLNTGTLLLSDKAALLFCILAAGSTLPALGAPGTRAALSQLALGASAAAAAAVRPIAAALLVAGSLPVFIHAIRDRRTRAEIIRIAGRTLAGASAVAVPVSAILFTSGFPPFRWTAYGFWTPKDSFPGLVDFAVSYAFAGNPSRPFQAGEPLLPHAQVVWQALLGIPGLGETHYLGYLWPLLGWGAMLLVLRRPSSWSGTQIALARSAAWWAIATSITFVFYSWPLPRYLVGSHWIVLIGTFGLLARRAATDRPGRAVIAVVLALLATGSSLALSLRADSAYVAWRDLNSETRSGFNAWLRLSDAERAGRKMPFDPLRAQALGLLRFESASKIRCWGLPIGHHHWFRLKTLGLLRVDPDRRIHFSAASAPFVRPADECSRPD